MIGWRTHRGSSRCERTLAHMTAEDEVQEKVVPESALLDPAGGPEEDEDWPDNWANLLAE
jgi:hypothetical protein